MSLILNKEEIYKRLTFRNLKIKPYNMLQMLELTEQRCIRFSENSKLNYGEETHINPLLWQIGHVVFFYSNLVLRNLNGCINIEEIEDYSKYVEFYDSYLTPLENRNGKYLLDYKTVIELYKKIILYLKEFILYKSYLTTPESYLILLGILHNEMHNEAFIFTKINLNKSNEYLSYEYSSPDTILINNIDFVTYQGGYFTQGSHNSDKKLIFDNELPSFSQFIKSFMVSKFCITESQFLEFILNNGYNEEKYWSANGYKYIKKNKIEMPLYWVKRNDSYFKELDNHLYSVNTNLPIINISWYEAEAYCSWKGGRLLTESEFEYISTNEGQTLYPWGDEEPDDEKCNLNYKKNVVSVLEYKKGINKKNVYQLIGNVWEWCQEAIYPYDGFIIDPVYREMSYPFFGFKKICKGGACSVPDFLIHPRYRNAQYPDCRIQFIGFRLAKSI